MVRVAGLLEQDEAGLGVRSTDGLTASQALTEIHRRVVELTVRQSRLWRRELRPALADTGIEIAAIEDCSAKELGKLEAFFEREIYPVLDTARGRSRAAVPVHLRALAVTRQCWPSTRRRSMSGSRGSRFPKGSIGSFASAKKLVPLESVIAHFLPMLFPGMEIEERAVFRVTRDADFEVSDDADDLLEAVESELRNRRFGDVVRVEVSASASRAMRERLIAGLGVRPGQVYEIEGLLDMADLWELYALERPDLKDEAVGPGRPPALGTCEERRPRVRRDQARRHPRPPAVRVVPCELRGVRGRGLARPGRDCDQDHGVPDERRLVARLVADRVRGGGQAVGLSRRAQSAVRRTAQHRVVTSDGAGGRPRRPRLPRPQDPREDDARRPTRGVGPAAIRPHRDGELQLGHGPAVRGRRAVHRGRGDRGRRRRPVQLRHRLRSPAAVPQAARRAVRDAAIA